MSPDPRWEGAVNARLLIGDIYRMGRSEWLTEKGWQEAYDDGVRTVVDLRNPGERQRRPTDPVVREEIMDRFTIVNCPTEDPDNEEFKARFVPYMNHPRSYADYLRIFPRQVTAVFKELAVARGNVVINCSAGRDRTGMIATMLLRLAGADESHIAGHYELSMRGINAWHLVSPTKHPYEHYHAEDELAPMIQDRLAALEGFADGIDVAGFLLANGMGGDELDALRRRLTGKVK